MEYQTVTVKIGQEDSPSREESREGITDVQGVCCLGNMVYRH